MSQPAANPSQLSNGGVCNGERLETVSRVERRDIKIVRTASELTSTMGKKKESLEPDGEELPPLDDVLSRASKSRGLNPKPEERRVDRGGRAGDAPESLPVDSGDPGNRDTDGLRMCLDAIPIEGSSVSSGSLARCMDGNMTET